MITTPGGLFGRLRGEQQGYLRLALNEEHAHYNYLIGRGAQPLTKRFYFPASTFSFSGFPIFLAAMDTIETASLGLYLTAARRLSELGQPLLAEIAAQIMGVEAEHRILGRLVGAEPRPHDLCMERARYACLGDASADLAIFLQGAPGHMKQASMPAGAAIDAAIDHFGCAPVAVAAEPALQYVPLIRR